ncbi:hypothetical protein [Pseudarthrobacter cellobiosi]|uniref:hypothetical protein n=1 Tax=Pseudarthrobacter cellobiosi TaxID=2953654 RepID=UPI00208FADC7|nr:MULTISPECIES: hypothetical protein [unclassified Pseudarthrobacter]MCO4254253.1 hypothetical protein [Pseudarthrobacter sp. HLT1-5]MCO4275905.1 hypothetical protein [Pseudarthrobacter sp. HLT3-5]
MQIDGEERDERPEKYGSQTFQNIARDVPGHEVAVSSSNKQSDDQIDHPDKTYSASAQSASAKSAHHRFSPNVGLS